MNTPPDINDSSREQREAYIEQRFRCISNCESCGNCAILHGREAEDVYSDYIDGKKSFREVLISLNRK